MMKRAELIAALRNCIEGNCINCPLATDPECGIKLKMEAYEILQAYSQIEDADCSVRHGHWEHDDTGANFCSACGEYPYDDGEYHLVWHTNYCPHCGEKMDGED